MPKKSDAGGMSDKSRQEFVEKWLPMMPSATGYERNRSRSLLEKMLLEYDKLKSDKWARLKEFVAEKLEYYRNFEDKADIPAWVLGKDTMKDILAEIERLEKEESDDE